MRSSARARGGERSSSREGRERRVWALNTLAPRNATRTRLRKSAAHTPNTLLQPLFFAPKIWCAFSIYHTTGTRVEASKRWEGEKGQVTWQWHLAEVGTPRWWQAGCYRGAE